MLFALPILLSLAATATARVVIDHQPAQTGRYVGSPSIVILPNGDYVSSHDLFGQGSTQSTSPVTRVLRSTDRGLTWRQAVEFNDQFWSNLFVGRGQLLSPPPHPPPPRNRSFQSVACTC